MFLPKILFNLVRQEINRGERDTWRQQLLLLFIGVPAKFVKVEGEFLIVSFNSSRKHEPIHFKTNLEEKLGSLIECDNFQDLQETRMRELLGHIPSTQKTEFWDYVNEFNSQNITIMWFRNFVKIVAPAASAMTAYFQAENRRLSEANRRLVEENQRRLDEQQAEMSRLREVQSEEIRALRESVQRQQAQIDRLQNPIPDFTASARGLENYRQLVIAEDRTKREEEEKRKREDNERKKEE